MLYFGQAALKLLPTATESHPTVYLGYNTNGWAHHTTRDALRILSEIGYESVAVTLERAHLDPPDRSAVKQCMEGLAPLVRDCGLRSTVETGARFILDPRRKHQPTLIGRTPQEREQRIEFLHAAVQVAAGLGADSVALWSGAADGTEDEETLFDRLVDGLGKVLGFAQDHNVRLSFEPEPGMLIETMAQFERLHRALDHELFGLTLDVGHVHCLGDGLVDDHIRRWRNELWNLHIEDMRCGRHEHLMFGHGDMEFDPVFEALREIDYRGPVHVELSRHSHDAVASAERAYAFLRPFLDTFGT